MIEKSTTYVSRLALSFVSFHWLQQRRNKRVCPLQTNKQTSDMLLLLAVGAACSWAQPSRFSPPGPLEPHFMMLLSTGCSGSTWVFDTLVKMIEAHRLANHSSVLPVMLGPTRFVASTPHTRDSCDPPLPWLVSSLSGGHSEVTFLCAC